MLTSDVQDGLPGLKSGQVPSGGSQLAGGPARLTLGPSLPPARMTGPSTDSPEAQFDFPRGAPPLPLLPTPRYPTWHKEALQASQ